ncbi:MAG: 23S rRNA pseudouridine(1911/1915/1917) synthase RluD [Gammaproteobacteria bacterium]|nr:23S rRNA pseudouridine(1911/1915/1917) synthase RluD [Gammaproteobacteria bacterium]
MSLEKTIRIRLAAEQAGNRLDKVLVEMFPQYSRSCLQGWLKSRYITVNDKPATSKQKVQGDEWLQVDIPRQGETGDVQAEAIDLSVVFEDPDLIVINKPAGMVVHPAAGNPGGTLQNALLHHFPELAGLPRSGIVHRLDKETSGLLVIARNLPAHKSLVEQLRQRTISREYVAIVQGRLVAGGTVDAPIGRHPQDRKRMCVRQGGRKAITHYRISERYRQHTCLQVILETGRTHQIRVHMAHINKPIVGDPVYGGRLRIPAGSDESLKRQLGLFKRQALHAASLGVLHPANGKALQWQAPIPDDMQALIAALRNDCAQHGEVPDAPR